MTEPDAFLDTNLLPRHVLQDHADHSARATALFVAIEQDQRAVRLAEMVVFEAAFTLEKTYRVPRADIRDALLTILTLPGVVLPGERIFEPVCALYVREAGLSLADCYHLELAKQLGFNRILSFDRKIGRLPDVTRGGAVGRGDGTRSGSALPLERTPAAIRFRRDGG